MGEKRSKKKRAEEPAPVVEESDAGEGDSSIEILEVVGVDKDDSGPNPPKPASAGASGEEDDSIPYSRKELYDMLLRKQAEFENARKRLDREREDGRRQVWFDLLRRLLPVVDNLDRALIESSPSHSGALREGVALTMQQMKEILEREGLQEITAVGERFDPHLHEAVETRWVEGFEEGVVLEQLRKGYLFQGQLLRPALVRVSARGGKGAREDEA